MTELHTCPQCGNDKPAGLTLCHHCLPSDIPEPHSTAASNPQYVLCGNCLAVSEYSDAKHNEDEFCSCGGAWCGCDGCNDMILNPENWYAGVSLQLLKSQFLNFQKGFAPLIVRVPLSELSK